MAVIMSLVSVLIVLAITYNQGAARSVDSKFMTSNDLYSSEEWQAESGGVRTYTIPTAMRKDYAITIKGTIDTSDSTLIVELPSLSGKESCRIQFNYSKKHLIYITPAVEGYEKTEYDLIVKPGSEGPSFKLTLAARKDIDNKDMYGMTFETREIGQSRQLLCKIENFQDINQIVIKQGVARVDSLLFEYKRVIESGEN